MNLSFDFMPAKHDGTLVVNGVEILYCRNFSGGAFCFCSETSFCCYVLNSRSFCIHVRLRVSGI